MLRLSKVRNLLEECCAVHIVKIGFRKRNWRRENALGELSNNEHHSGSGISTYPVELHEPLVSPALEIQQGIEPGVLHGAKSQSSNVIPEVVYRNRRHS